MESYNECVTTQGSKLDALKMNGAQTAGLEHTIVAGIGVNL